MLQRWEILDLKKFFISPLLMLILTYCNCKFLLDGYDICDKAQTKFLHSNLSLFLIGWSCFPKDWKTQCAYNSKYWIFENPCIGPILKYFNVNAYLLYEKPSVECHAGTICSVTWREYKSKHFSGLKVHMTKACKVNLRQNWFISLILSLI